MLIFDFPWPISWSTSIDFTSFIQQGKCRQKLDLKIANNRTGESDISLYETYLITTSYLRKSRYGSKKFEKKA